MRDTRSACGLSQATLARKLNIESDRLSAYERGRNPLPFFLADCVCYICGANLRWLATGALPKSPALGVASIIAETVPRQSALSRVYDRVLALLFDAQLRELATKHDRNLEDLPPEALATWIPLFEAEGTGLMRTVRDHAEIVAVKAAAISQHRLKSLIKRLASLEDDFSFTNSECKERQREDAEQAATLQSEILNLLASNAVDMESKRFTYSEVEETVPRLCDLISRVRSLTEARGSKRSLAVFLGVLPQQLNKWLSGVSEPGGDTTLRLLEWVIAAEAQQQKEPSGALTPKGRKTQARSLDEKKASSGPP